MSDEMIFRNRWKVVERLDRGGQGVVYKGLDIEGRPSDLSDETVKLLREHKRHQAEVKLKNRQHYVDLGLMFALEWENLSSKHRRLGLPLRRESVNRRLTKLCKSAKVKCITIYGLRHACGTLLMLAGVPPAVVQKRLGHADASMTLNIYSHVLPPD